MLSARRILVAASWLYVLGVAVQFFLAGLGSLGGESFSAHEGFGMSALWLSPLIILAAAWFARAPLRLLVLVIVFVVVSLVQPLWATEFEGEFLGALHVLGALVIFALAHAIAQRATALLRSANVAG